MGAQSEADAGDSEVRSCDEVQDTVWELTMGIDVIKVHAGPSCGVCGGQVVS